MRSRRSKTHDAPSGAVPEATSATLVVAGVLMLLAVFLMSNRWFGVAERLWPWELLTRTGGNLLVRGVFLIWLITAWWCLVMGLTRAQRVRSLGAAALTAVLLVECTSQGGGFVVDVYNLNQLLPMIGLGAGFVIARENGTRGFGRLLAGLSGATLLWVLASTFIEGGTTVQLAGYWRDLTLIFSDWNHEFARPNHLWWSMVPRTFVILASLAGVLAGLGLSQRKFLLGGFIALLVGIVFPFGVGTVLMLQKGSGMNMLVQQLAQTFIAQGFLLWFLSVFVIFDLARGRMRTA